MSFLSLFTKPAESVADTINTKLKSPFFGTFLIVWIIRHKLFIYDLFFNELKPDKTGILKENLNYCDWSFWGQLGLTLVFTLLLLFLYYFSLNVSRLLTVASEDNLKLMVYKWFGSKRYVDRDKYNTLKNEFEKVFKENTALDESNRNYRNINDQLNSDIIGLNKTILKNDEKMSADKKQIIDLNKILEKLQKQLQNETKNLADATVKLADNAAKITSKDVLNKKIINSMKDHVSSFESLIDVAVKPLENKYGIEEFVDLKTRLKGYLNSINLQLKSKKF